jgi:serine/threonine protein phosphatase PrpC
VVATPDIEEFSLEEGDEFLVIACDGIWDVLTNQEVGGW